MANVLAETVFEKIFEFRRLSIVHGACGWKCEACRLPHFSKVDSAIREGKPLVFVLPAFPGKSPNQAKVLGVLPDFGEQLALQFLNDLCNQINAVYSPGARIILCSDGRVFSDLVGMQEKGVTEYQLEIKQMIVELELNNLSTFDLDETWKGASFSQMREQLMMDYGLPLESLRQRVLTDGHTRELLRGITRFLVEDARSPEQLKSKTTVQKESKAKAYEVIRRSNAWSKLIAEVFPEAVRLSIHPQACGSEKLGIRLIGNENWMTPWHGVAVKTQGGFVLLKRYEAEALGARLVSDRLGRPSYFDFAGELGGAI